MILGVRPTNLVVNDYLYWSISIIANLHRKSNRKHKRKRGIYIYYEVGTMCLVIGLVVGGVRGLCKRFSLRVYRCISPFFIPKRPTIL